MKKYLPLLGSLSLSTQLPAVVISGTNIVLGDGSAVGFDYEILIWEDAGANDPTSMWFDYDGTTISPGEMNLDGGSDWYVTSFNDVFSSPNVLAGAFPLTAKSDMTGLTYIDQVVGSDFYLGVSTDGAGQRSNFGWAQFNFSGGTLSIVDSAVAYDMGNGIIAGTTQTVPEPSSALLATCALGLGAIRRRR
ncbi:hypothetical protein N9986_03350 [Akkermansiaceae bacterium]|nr:hypothetical protein [Akkermansiaceae bacterium]